MKNWEPMEIIFGLVVALAIICTTILGLAGAI